LFKYSTRAVHVDKHESIFFNNNFDIAQADGVASAGLIHMMDGVWLPPKDVGPPPTGYANPAVAIKDQKDRGMFAEHLEATGLAR